MIPRVPFLACDLACLVCIALNKVVAVICRSGPRSGLTRGPGLAGAKRYRHGIRGLSCFASDVQRLRRVHFGSDRDGVTVTVSAGCHVLPVKFVCVCGVHFGSGCRVSHVYVRVQEKMSCRQS